MRRLLIAHTQSRPATTFADETLLAGEHTQDALERIRLNPFNVRRSATFAFHIDYLLPADIPCIARSIVATTFFGDPCVRFDSMIDIT